MQFPRFCSKQAAQVALIDKRSRSRIKAEPMRSFPNMTSQIALLLGFDEFLH